MKFQFFSIPVHDPALAQDELNRFLAAHRVLAVDRQLVADGTRSTWALCVSYSDGPGPAAATAVARRGKPIDYRDVLPADEFALFARLRTLRKELAEKEGVPPYAVFTNEQLAALVERRVSTEAGFGAIEGIGPARVAKYAKPFLVVLGPAVGDLQQPAADAVAGGTAGGGAPDLASVDDGHAEP